MKKILSVIIFLIFNSLIFNSLIINSLIINAQHLKKDGTPDLRYKENRQTYSVLSVDKSKSSPKSYTKYSSQPSKKTTVIQKPSKKITLKANTSVRRDKNGRIARSESAKRQFKKQTGYPNGRPGYVIDHIVPLKKGGCDCPANMQWQTVKAAKAKDKWE